MKYYIKNGSNTTSTVAVIFDNNTAFEENPKKFNYRIRSYERGVKWQTNEAFPKNHEYSPGFGNNISF